MDVGKTCGRNYSNTSNISQRKKLDKIIENDNFDLDWGNLITPKNKVCTASIPNPYVYSSDHVQLVENEEIDVEDIELSSLESILEMDDMEILRRSSLIARDLKFRIANDLSTDQISAINIINESVHWLKQNMQIISERIGQDEHNDCSDSIKSCNQINLLGQDSFDDISQYVKLEKMESDECIDKSSDDKNVSISRNSYKFCDFGHTCSFSYSLEDKRDCYSQHYVYPLILSDIQNLIDHILMDDGTYNTSIQTKEIITSINTITYVINHMYNELVDLRKFNQIGYDYYSSRKLNLKCMSKNIKRRNRKKKLQ